MANFVGWGAAALAGLLVGAGIVAAILGSRLSARRAEIEALRAELRARKNEEQLLAEARESLAASFESIAGRTLQDSSRNLLDLARRQFDEHKQAAGDDLEHRRKAVDELIKPIRDALAKVEGKVEQAEKERIEAYGNLSQHLTGLASSQAQLQKETASLVQALRAPHVRGRWGEIQLKRVVELAGMLAYCDFAEQQTIRTDEDTRRPDVVIKLPGGRTIVVDSKAPLTHYLDSLDATDPAVRRAKLGEHARLVRQHLQSLGSVAYWNRLERSPEFVVMFLPGETFFSAALEQDPSLIEFGVDNRVILATPTTLIALLKAVAYGWREERVAENAAEISKLGKELYDRLAVFTEHFVKLRTALARTIKVFNEAAGSLEGRVLVSARRFQEMGAGSGDDIPSAEAIDRMPRTMAAQEAASQLQLIVPPAPDRG